MPYDRSGGKASNQIILSVYFQQNGVGANVYAMEKVDIYSPLGTLIDTVTTIANPSDGLYSISWDVPDGAPIGTWTDIWRNIKFTPLAEYIDTSNTFFIVPDDTELLSTGTTIIYTYLQYPNGEPQIGKTGYVELLEAPVVVDGLTFTNPTPYGTSAVSDSSGRLLWELPLGAKIRISIPHTKTIFYKQLPTASTSTNIEDLGDL